MTLAAVLLCLWMLTGCSRPADADQMTEQQQPGKKAEVTPAIQKKAQELLESHADAPIGSEYRFSVDGKSYVARIETHDNPSGETGRPPGKHRGVTVYVAE